jgi:hypothetical protein
MLSGSLYYPHLYIVKEDGDPGLRIWAASTLIEDRSDQASSYPQFLQHLREKVCHLELALTVGDKLIGMSISAIDSLR